MKIFSRVTSIFVLSTAFLSIGAVSYLRFLDSYELEALDLRFLARSHISKPVMTDKVVIIEIGEDSIKRLGRFPFDRSYHAILIKALKEFEASKIVFDIFFSEPQEHDRDMEEAMRAAGNVYLPFAFEIDTGKKAKITSSSDYLARCLENLALLSRGIGHINIIPDIDGKFRRVPLYIRHGNAFYPYISFLVACDYLNIPEKDVKMLPGEYLLCGQDLKIPLDENSNMIINFSGRWNKIYKHYSYADVLQSYFSHVSGQSPNLKIGDFKDKVCIIGLTASGTGDLHPNPFEALYPGVGIHAEVFNSMLNKIFISRLSKKANLAILAILGILIAIATLKAKPIKGLLVLISSIFVFAVCAVLLFSFYGVWIDMIYPILIMALLYSALTLYKYVVEWKRRLVMESELEIAKKIQESFLPKAVPGVTGIDIARTMFTARQVGGDLYDFVELGPDRFGLAVGDVSGKGVPASLFMAMTVGAFRSFAVPGARPEDVLASLNTKLVKESSSNLFVTIFYSIFDIKRKTMVYANGGHLPVLHFGSGREAESLDVEDGAPLGLMDGPYSAGEIVFSEGDIFIFFTDGVTEAMNERRELYGKERLVSIVGKKRGGTSQEILEAIDKDIKKFEPRSRQHDDITIIVVRIV